MAFDRDHKVFNAIRAKILFGDLPPGAPISVSDLSEELVTSGAPVREALIRLAERDIVDSFTGRGFFVKSDRFSHHLEAAELLSDIAYDSMEQSHIDLAHLTTLHAKIRAALEERKLDWETQETIFYEFLDIVDPYLFRNIRNILADKTANIRYYYYKTYPTDDHFIRVLWAMCFALRNEQLGRFQRLANMLLGAAKRLNAGD